MRRMTWMAAGLAAALLLCLLAGCRTETEKTALTEGELDELSTWLSQPGVCELFRSGFNKGEEADLSDMFYDGAGLDMGELTQEERDALAGQGAEPGLDVIKVTVEQVRGLVAERLGVENVSVDWLRAKMADWIYLAQFDAFYHIHGDTLMRNVTCDSGTWEADGSLLVDCRCSDLEIGRVVRLYPNEGGGYRIGYIRAPGG